LKFVLCKNRVHRWWSGNCADSANIDVVFIYLYADVKEHAWRLAPGG